MTPVILDTCAIIYLFQEHCIIHPQIIRKIETSAVILSVSFAEIACKIKLNKLCFEGFETSDILNMIQNLENMEIVSINAQMWLESVALDWPENRDPVDRLIVSYAKKRQWPIVTSDQKMTAFYNDCLL